jgi:hypothetical protein
VGWDREDDLKITAKSGGWEISRWGEKTRTTCMGRAGDRQSLGGLALVTLATASSSTIATVLVVSWFLWARLCHIDFPPVQFLATELSDGLLGGAILRHLDEGESLGAARHAVRNEVYGGDLSHRSEKLGQIALGRRVTQVTYVQFLCHFLILSQHKAAYRLQGPHVSGLQPLGTLLDVELDLLALVQRAKSLHFDRRMMDKYVLSGFAGNEAISFARVEPFDGSGFFFCHFLYSLSKIF